MKSQSLLFTFSALFISLMLSSVQAQDTIPELGKYVDQYEGQAGARKFDINVLRIGPKDKEEVLIQISGVDDQLDGKIYKYKKSG